MGKGTNLKIAWVFVHKNIPSIPPTPPPPQTPVWIFSRIAHCIRCIPTFTHSQHRLQQHRVLGSQRLIQFHSDYQNIEFPENGCYNHVGIVSVYIWVGSYISIYTGIAHMCAQNSEAIIIYFLRLFQFGKGSYLCRVSDIGFSWQHVG